MARRVDMHHGPPLTLELLSAVSQGMLGRRHRPASLSILRGELVRWVTINANKV